MLSNIKHVVAGMLIGMSIMTVVNIFIKDPKHREELKEERVYSCKVGVVFERYKVPKDPLKACKDRG